MYHALKDRNVPVEFIAYPVSGHFPGDPVRGPDVDRRWVEWIDPAFTQSLSMPITRLDSVAALLVIDLQKGIVGRPTVHPAKDIVSRAGALAAAFRRRGLPVVLVNVAGAAPGRVAEVRGGPFPADWAELVPELNRQPQDHTVTKRTWGAFTNTDLAMYLKGAA